MYFLAIDEGTSSTRAMLYDEQGRLCHKSQYPLMSFYPQPGWVEQDPEEIWQKTQLAIRDVASQVCVKDILACGITNQRETTVIWDKQTGRCLGPAISWQDTRTAALFESLTPEEMTRIYAKTGLQPNPYFSAGKLCWLLNQVDHFQQRLKEGSLAFGTIDSFLLWRLSKEQAHLTDITNASRTLLFNIHTLSWDPDLLEFFNIPESILPSIAPNDAYFGRLDASILGVEIPITAMIGDQQSALIGQACVQAGMMKATYGSGGFLLLNTGTQCIWSTQHLLTTIAYNLKDNTLAYGLEGSIYQVGSTLKWLCEQLKILPNISDSEQIAAKLSHNAGVYLIPSFTGLGAPHWAATDGAMILGLSQNSTSEHLVRAALESVAFQTKDILVCMQADYKDPITTLRVDGGMANNSWLLQYLASICNLKIERPKAIETTGLGAAMLAAVGSGYISSLSELKHYWQLHSTYNPDENQAAFIADYQGWIQALRKVMA